MLADSVALTLALALAPAQTKPPNKLFVCHVKVVLSSLAGFVVRVFHVFPTPSSPADHKVGLHRITA